MYEKTSALLNDVQFNVDPAIIEIVFSDGEIGIVELKKQNGEYYVYKKYFSEFAIDKQILNELN